MPSQASIPRSTPHRSIASTSTSVSELLWKATLQILTVAQPHRGCRSLRCRPSPTGHPTRHWLRSARSQIDHGQTPVTECHSCVSVDQDPPSSGPRCSTIDAMLDASAAKRSALVDAAGSRMQAIPQTRVHPTFRRMVKGQPRSFSWRKWKAETLRFSLEHVNDPE